MNLVKMMRTKNNSSLAPLVSRKDRSMMNITKQIARMALGFVLASIPMLAGCAPTEIDWSEEVKLHDGKIIVVKRHEELGLTGLPLAHRGSRKYWLFCYAPMNIIWKSKPEYFPEVFDIVDGKAYVRVTISSCASCQLHGFPETSALYFVWDGGAWKKIDYKDFPPGLRFNMLGSTHYDDDGSRDVRGLLTIGQKESRAPEMYWLMRKKPEIVGLNDRVTYLGPNQPPVHAREACKQCNGSGAIYYGPAPTNEVFLPASRTDCK
jgi:hypothetical protein